jgi:predicted nucleotide-binding protein
MADDWSNWTNEQLEHTLFDAHPGSVNHEKAKYLLEKRRHEKEVAQKKVIEASFSPEKGIKVLTGLRQEGSELLSHRPLAMDDVHAWVQKGRELLIRCFGSESKTVSDFEYAGVNSWPERDAPNAWDDLHAKTLTFQLKLIGNCMELLQNEADLHQSPTQNDPEPNQPKHAVFLVHGQNEAVRERTARFLERLDVELVILQEQADKNRTVIEKFLDYSSEVGFAVVLLTADDRGGPRDAKYEDQHFRARQNVWLELGFFIGKLGRQQVCALCEEGIEIPSDYHGVLFVPLDKEGAWKLKLAKEIKTAGIPIDLNKAV